MVSLTRILCPVDLSDCSRLALRYAAAMGKWYGAGVTAVHVFENLPVILTSSKHVDPVGRAAGIMLGADDYLVKPLDPAELAARMRRSLKRSHRSVVERPSNRTSHTDDLSRREREILLLLAEGETEKEIAAALVLSPKTVATHIQNTLRKLGVHSRTQAVAAAYRDGLMETVRS